MPGVVAPTTLPNGAVAWLDDEVRQFTRDLHELSPRLALFREADKGWSIVEVCEDGRPRLVCRSKPNAKLGPEVIAMLREHDIRSRANQDIAQRVISHNEKIVADKDAKIIDKRKAVEEKIGFYLRRAST